MAFTEKQEKAIKKLEAAFRQCKKVGLNFVGMENTILAFDSKELTKAMKDKDIYNAMRELEQGKSINTKHSYIDSGGW